MNWKKPLFLDRYDAGRQLAARLVQFSSRQPLILALPRGGVPVAFEAAKALHVPMDLLIVRKIGAPDHPEYGLGAVVDGHEPQIVFNDEALRIFHPSKTYIEHEVQYQLQEIERRRKTYLAARPSPQIKDRTVIVVDDGIATGGTVKAALRALRKAGAAHIILAVPVGPREVIEALRADADEIVCLNTPEPFQAVGLYYANFQQTSDQEVIDLLEQTTIMSRASS